MIGVFRKERPDILDKPISDVLVEMSLYGPDTPEFKAQIENLERLTELKEKKTSKTAVSPDTIAIVVGNLVSVALILGYEHGHVLTTKALGFLLKKNP